MDNINLDIYDKQFVTLLGPSGCGKSMTLKSIAGIVNPDEGIVSLSTGEETVYFDSDKKLFAISENTERLALLRYIRENTLFFLWLLSNLSQYKAISGFI